MLELEKTHSSAAKASFNSYDTKIDQSYTRNVNGKSTVSTLSNSSSHTVGHKPDHHHGDGNYNHSHDDVDQSISRKSGLSIEGSPSLNFKPSISFNKTITVGGGRNRDKNYDVKKDAKPRGVRSGSGWSRDSFWSGRSFWGNDSGFLGLGPSRGGFMGMGGGF